MPGFDDAYQAISDEDLVDLAKNGDDAAMAALIARLSPLAKARAALAGSRQMEPEDLAQEGMIGFLRAVAGYDREKGASFRTYAACCMYRHMLSAIRSTAKKQAVPAASLVSIDSETFDLADTQADPQDMLQSREADDLFSERLQKKLSNLERQVAALYMDGHSYKEIARKLQISDKSVDNAMQRVRKKLEP